MNEVIESKEVFVRPVLKNSPLSEALEKHGMRSLNDAPTTLVADIVNGMVQTGLNKEEQERLEKELGLKPGDLNPFPQTAFWHDFYIKLNSQPMKLNKENPMDFLKYKVLAASSKVAASEEEIDPDCLFYIEDIQNETEKLSKKSEVKLEATELFNKLDITDRKKVLKIYGINGDSNTEGFVKGKLFELLEENPSKFIKLSSKSKQRLTIEAFIFDLVNNGILRAKGDNLFDGDSNLGSTDELVERYLNPKHQEEYLMYKDRLDFKSK